ncbi:hypothetical protein D9599_25730 [Roseomonas sp. KE2513]|uniref:hypothetical protein n=1 Tax=Roseomonas sp. KE2513 TaxID=2479202 RepID=UPI0018DF9393|nr:hypothetical protein [Roseomonas sp. KE2513]MBI0538958.1 hypothetical protein [Roseomonas sp. KE2513]
MNSRLTQRLDRLEGTLAPPIERVVVAPCGVEGDALQAWKAATLAKMPPATRLILIHTGVPRDGE